MNSAYILGELFHVLPYQMAIDIIKEQDTQDRLQNVAEPDEIKQICRRLISGASVLSPFDSISMIHSVPPPECD